MLGQTAIALAMMKWGKHRAGQTVMVGAEEQLVSATTHALPFV
jgi:glycine cleavage system aminomethyltransferase T